ncbi:MAG: PhoH family protein [Planctomycetota bacterium]|nr:PhoH family protein [Planctomycetota bacterium]
MPRERIPETGEREQRVLFGPMDQHLRAIRTRFGVRVSVRNSVLLIEGEDAQAVREVARRVKAVLKRVKTGREPAVEDVARMLLDGEEALTSRSTPGSGRPRQARSTGGKARGKTPPIPVPPPPPAAPDTSPKTKAQAEYVEAIQSHDVVIAIGPAGTGKTFLAVVQAVEALRSGATRKIILTRPAVEAGEKLGFLPGDFQAKINPYLRPLYDALGELIPWAEVQRYINADVIEIVPLAYMRGRTLKDAFIILDEAQNTTPAQMKMFLTRMGTGSQIVITGDTTQIDLPGGTRSGLIESVQILRRVKGISVIELTAEDIMRHALVQRIVDAYDDHESWGADQRERAEREAADDADAEIQADAPAEAEAPASEAPSDEDAAKDAPAEGGDAA